MRNRKIAIIISCLVLTLALVGTTVFAVVMKKNKGNESDSSMSSDSSSTIDILTPNDYSDNYNISTALSNFYDEDAYSSGTVSTISFSGIDVKVETQREVKGNEVKATQKYTSVLFDKNFGVYVDSNNNFCYFLDNDLDVGVQKVSGTSFKSTFGYIPKGLSKFFIADGEIDFSTKLLYYDDNEYIIRCTPDDIAYISDRVGVELKTVFELNVQPIFKSLYFEITIDSQWNILCVTGYSTFYMDMFGGVTASEVYVENFTYGGNVDGSAFLGQAFIEPENLIVSKKNGLSLTYKTVEKMLCGNDSYLLTVTGGNFVSKGKHRFCMRDDSSYFQTETGAYYLSNGYLSAVALVAFYDENECLELNKLLDFFKLKKENIVSDIDDSGFEVNIQNGDFKLVLKGLFDNEAQSVTDFSFETDDYILALDKSAEKYVFDENADYLDYGSELISYIFNAFTTNSIYYKVICDGEEYYLLFNVREKIIKFESKDGTFAFDYKDRHSKLKVGETYYRSDNERELFEVLETVAMSKNVGAVALRTLVEALNSDNGFRLEISDDNDSFEIVGDNLIFKFTIEEGTGDIYLSKLSFDVYGHDIDADKIDSYVFYEFDESKIYIDVSPVTEKVLAATVMLAKAENVKAQLNYSLDDGEKVTEINAEVYIGSTSSKYLIGGNIFYGETTDGETNSYEIGFGYYSDRFYISYEGLNVSVSREKVQQILDEKGLSGAIEEYGALAVIGALAYVFKDILPEDGEFDVLSIMEFLQKCNESMYFAADDNSIEFSCDGYETENGVLTLALSLENIIGDIVDYVDIKAFEEYVNVDDMDVLIRALSNSFGYDNYTFGGVASVGVNELYTLDINYILQIDTVGGISYYRLNLDRGISIGNHLLYDDYGGTATIYFSSESENVYTDVRSCWLMPTLISSAKYNNYSYTDTKEDIKANMKEYLYKVLMPGVTIRGIIDNLIPSGGEAAARNNYVGYKDYIGYKNVVEESKEDDTKLFETVKLKSFVYDERYSNLEILFDIVNDGGIKSELDCTLYLDENEMIKRAVIKLSFSSITITAKVNSITYGVYGNADTDFIGKNK